MWIENHVPKLHGKGWGGRQPGSSPPLLLEESSGTLSYVCIRGGTMGV